MTAPRGSAEDLQISAPDPGTDGPKLIDLLCKTFAVSAGYWQGERICRDGLLLNSNYDWNASRVGKLGSEIVSHFGIWKLQVRVGRARIRTAGIGSVATDGHYRKRGFLRQTANATLEALRDSDYEVSVLFGIPNFYEAVTLRIKQGKIELLPGSRSENSISGGEAIAQLMFGTDDPQETIDSGGIRLRGQAKFLVPVLFPNEYPALSFWDRV